MSGLLQPEDLKKLKPAETWIFRGADSDADRFERRIFSRAAEHETAAKWKRS